jgi:uncharacterized protein YjbJ (UPF0337 family)
MNEDIFAGQWQQLRGVIKSWWGNLTDDDFQWIGGQKDRLIGLVQQKYGWTRAQAEDEVERRLDEYQNVSVGKTLADLKAKTHALGETAANKARDALSTAANKWESAGSYLKEKRFDALASVGIGLGYFLSRRKY